MLHKEIHETALAAATRYKRSEVELIEVLQQVWTCKTFYHFGCSSLFQYSVSKLGLSPEVTNIFNKITKKTLKVRGFKEQIENGNISLSNASRIWRKSIEPKTYSAKSSAEAQRSKRSLKRH